MSIWKKLAEAKQSQLANEGQAKSPLFDKQRSQQIKQDRYIKESKGWKDMTANHIDQLAEKEKGL